MKRVKLSWKIFIIVVAVCLISALMIFPELSESFFDWVASLSPAAIKSGLPDLFKLAVQWIAAPILGLLSLFGIVISRELAALLTLSLSASIVFLAEKMMRSSFTKIAFRNVPRRKLRNGLTILAIVLGVALVVGVNISFDSAYAQFKSTINQAAGNVDITIRSGLDVPFEKSFLEYVREMDDVANASGRVSEQAVLLNSDEDWEVLTILGVDSSSDFSYLESNITRKFHFVKTPITLKENDAVVDEGLNYAIGDLIRVYVITDSSQTEQLNQGEQIDLTRLFSFKVAGIYHSEQMMFTQSDRHTIYIDLAKAQEIFELQDELEYIIVKVADIEKTGQVIENLKSELGRTYIVTATKRSILAGMGEAFLGFRSGLQIMSALAIGVGTVIILNTIYMNVGERTYEIGVLRSIGSSTRQIFWMFFSESLTLGFIGVPTGLLSGFVLSKAFLALTYYLRNLIPPVTTFVVLPWHLILGAVIGLTTSVVGASFPSMLACRIDVINALRPTMRKVGKYRTALKLILAGSPLIIAGFFVYLRFTLGQSESGLITTINALYLVLPLLLSGLILLSAGLLRILNPVIERLLVPFGSTRKIISRNIERNLVRSTICFTLIGMTLTFVVVISGAQAGMVTGMENVIRSFYSSDLTVSSQTLLPTSFSDDLVDIDGGTLIDTAAPTLIVPRKIMLENVASSPDISTNVVVFAIDPTTYYQVMPVTFSDETPSDVFTRLKVPGTIILAAPLAESMSVTVNSLVRMHAASDDGDTQTWDLAVVGVATGTYVEFGEGPSDYSVSDACYISYESLNTYFSEYADESNLFFTKMESGQDAEHVKARVLELYGGTYQLSVITVEDALVPARAGINMIFMIINIVVLFALVNASIGVTAIMIMNVTERRREIGVMRSQGMSNFQAVTSIVGEATVLAIVGFIVGTVAGLILHRVIVGYMSLTGFPIPYIIPFNGIGFSLVLAVAASVISAVYPAYRASKLNIVDALRH